MATPRKTNRPPMDASARKLPLAERFLAKIQPEPNSGCWLWAGAIEPPREEGSYGYGRIHIGVGQSAQRAHRFAYELFVGPIPFGFQVHHKCNVKSCVNPDHLYLGKEH